MPELTILPITNLMITLTNQCPLRCPFCFVPKAVNRMSYQTLYDATQYIIKNSEISGIQPRICFFGGEPLLEWDSLIVPITKYIRNEYKKPFILSMTTNGVLLTDDKVQFMRDNQIGALYSIDGGAETMAINRPFANGNNPSEIIETNLKNMLRYFPDAHARITLHSPSVSRLCDDIAHIHALGFQTISILPNLFEEWTDETVDTFREQVRLYGDRLIQCFRDGVEPEVWEQYVQSFYYIMLSNHCIEDNLYQQRLKCLGCGKCGFGIGGFATTDYLGNLYGCLHQDKLDENSKFYIGDIYHGVDEAKMCSFVEETDAETSNGVDCAGCKLAYICDTGCAPNNYMYSGKMKSPPPMFCHYYRALCDDAVRVCEILGAEKNTRFKEYFQRAIRVNNDG